MRPLYVIIGLLVGVSFTSQVADRVIASREANQHIYEMSWFLTGYHEGRVQGYQKGMAARFRLWYQCVTSLTDAYKHTAFIIEQTGYKEPDTDWKWKE